MQLLRVEGLLARLRFLHDRDVDLTGDRQPFSDEGFRDRSVARFAPRPGRRVEDFAVRGIRLEHDPLSADPLLEQIRAGADGVLHDSVARVLVHVDDLARDGSELTGRKPPRERVVGPVEADLQRVAVKRAQAFDGSIVIKRARCARTGEHVVEPDQVFLEQIKPVRADLGIDDPLDRIDVVVGSELAQVGQRVNAPTSAAPMNSQFFLPMAMGRMASTPVRMCS